jgi:TRAP transporter TAXI family solute receptor
MGSPRVGVLAAAVLLVLASGACAPGHRIQDLRLTTGNPEGVYHKLGTALAAAWSGQLNIEPPEVLPSHGSPDNLARLRSGQVDVAFTAADVAAIDTTEAELGDRKHKPRALARIYDDYLHVVVPAHAPLWRLADLRGHRVSIGSNDSGVEVIATRLLDVVGLTSPGSGAAPGGMTIEHLGLNESLTALRSGRIDAFFWSGGLPTATVQRAFEEAAAAKTPLRLLDLSDATPAIRERYPVYGTASIPASTYNSLDGPVTTLVVPNFLLVTDQMPEEDAEALTRGLFDARPELVLASTAALAIDVRSAIETGTVPLHPGAVRYYREMKI